MVGNPSRINKSESRPVPDTSTTMPRFLSFFVVVVVEVRGFLGRGFLGRGFLGRGFLERRLGGGGGGSGGGAMEEDEEDEDEEDGAFLLLDT